jgi:hypothetical protein
MRIYALLVTAVVAVRHRLAARDDPADRGDVPGWVMITVMTAALVVALLAIAAPKLGDLFTAAINKVSGG